MNGCSCIPSPDVPERISHWQLILQQGVLTPQIVDYPYRGSGTEKDPFVVTWIPDDPRDPMQFSATRKWTYTILVAMATLAVALVSSAYTEGLPQILDEFNISSEVGTLGVALFVVGFAIGPLLWAPLSELYGRQLPFFVSYGGLTAFNAGVPGSQNTWTLIILRFFAGAFGSSPLTNAGGVIADLFPASQRGLALSIFAAASFLGPVLGGFLGMTSAWKWVMGFLAAFSGTLWIICALLVPETFGPRLLEQRAKAMSRQSASGKIYRSELEAKKGKLSAAKAFKISLSRPWILLFLEPIVLLMSIYMAIIYGTLYIMASPVLLSGATVGMICAVVYNIFDNKRYQKTQERHNGFAPPEARLPPCLVGIIAIPLGLFWFAWTTLSSIHWVACTIAAAPFGSGMVLVFLSVMNYLIDAYTIYAASVLAANSVLRSLFGAAFPLFTQQMYANLGTQWASSVPAFLALAFKCKFAVESEAYMRQVAEEVDAREGASAMSARTTGIERAPSVGQSNGGDSSDTDIQELSGVSRTVGRARSTSLRRTSTVVYEGNPYDIDRVNTR
ncbi:hypothetical protein BDW75DRAFT_234638 [Aspergillus navahoensis]